MSSPAADIRGCKLGRYQVIDRLGSGGMAEVWLARQTGTAGFRKLVVIKTLHPHLAASQELVDMFIREASVAVGLSHPNVVQILDLGYDEGRHYMVMEYIAGTNLRRLGKKLRETQARLPLWALLDIATRVCEGLEHIHDYHAPDGTELNLVHRDLTPDNIMLSFTGNVKIVDFGVMRIRGVDKTGMGKIVGKPHYMAPEQIKDESVDHRADLYSLGVILYQFLAGRRPFSGRLQTAVMMSVVHDTPAPISDYNPGISTKLAAMVMKTMAYHADDRFQHAAHLADELLTLMRDKGFARNHRRMAMLVASCFRDSMQIPKQTLKLLEEAEVRSPGEVPPPRIVSGEIDIDIEELNPSTQHLSDHELDRLILELDHTPSSHLMSDPGLSAETPLVSDDSAGPPALPKKAKPAETQKAAGGRVMVPSPTSGARPQASKVARPEAHTLETTVEHQTSTPGTVTVTASSPPPSMPEVPELSVPRASSTPTISKSPRPSSAAAKPSTEKTRAKEATAKPTAKADNAQASTSKTAVGDKSKGSKPSAAGRPRLGRPKRRPRQKASSDPKKAASSDPTLEVAIPEEPTLHRATPKKSAPKKSTPKKSTPKKSTPKKSAPEPKSTEVASKPAKPAKMQAPDLEPEAPRGTLVFDRAPQRGDAQTTNKIAFEVFERATSGPSSRGAGTFGGTMFGRPSPALDEEPEPVAEESTVDPFGQAPATATSFFSDTRPPARDFESGFDSRIAGDDRPSSDDLHTAPWHPTPVGLRATMVGSFGDLIVGEDDEAETSDERAAPSPKLRRSRENNEPPSRAASLFDEGHVLMIEGDLRGARIKWEAACEEAPDNRTYSANLKRLKLMLAKEST